MHDIIALRQFYASPLGGLVKQWLRRYVAWRVGGVHGETCVGMGYAAPLFRAIENLSNAPKHVIALMPGKQGALYWPLQEDNRVALGALEKLPFQDSSVHWLVMLHALEHADDPEAVLAEAHRVLVPGGRVLMFVPHRHRPWRWWGDAPFKHGKAYGYSELKRLVRDAEFSITYYGGALMLPPIFHPLLRRLLSFCERAIGVLIPRMGSVMCVEVEKQIFAAMKQKRHQGALRIGVQPVPATAVPNAREQSD